MVNGGVQIVKGPVTLANCHGCVGHSRDSAVEQRRSIIMELGQKT